VKFSKILAKIRKRRSPDVSAESRLQTVSEAVQTCSGPIVRSICISMVKNEQDVIELFLRHNRQFFDAMIVLDNGSTDHTREIIVSCARELGGIFFTDLPRLDYAQSEFMTAALHFAQSAFFADFVCFLDADEFIGASDKAYFDRCLSAVPVGAASQHNWQTFLPNLDSPITENGDPMARMTLRRETENPQFSKLFLHLGGATVPGLTMDRGNHSVRSSTERTLTVVPVPDLLIRHFPVRSSAQLLAKGVLGWMSNISKKPSLVDEKAGYHGESYQWKSIFDLAADGVRDMAAADLAHEAMVYA
jgi:hypothetical protein